MKKTLLGIFALTLVLLVSQSQAQVPFTNDLVAYYTFDGNTLDASGNGHTGALFGAATYGVDRFGNSNACLSVPGAAGVGSGVDIPSLSSLPYLPVTYSAWFLLNSYLPPSAEIKYTLLGRNQCGNFNDGGITLFSDQSLHMTNLFLYESGALNYVSQVTPPTNTWCQVVVTIDPSGNVNLYFNGTNAPGSGAIQTNDQPLDFRIGAGAAGGCNNGVYYTWNGLIDDVRVYNTNLSASQIGQLYQYESQSESPCTPYSATATATETNGFVVGATVTDGGCGYTNIPLVLIQGGGGTGATAIAVVSNGVVAKITITDAGSNYISAPAIFIGGIPTIAAQPQSIIVSAHSNASFSVSATGAAMLDYQWSLNGTNIAGATSNTLTITNVVQTNLGTYDVLITDAFGATNSADAVLSMYPYLNSPFNGLVTYWGYTNTLSVGAWGTGPLEYQWFDNGSAIDGATNDTLSFNGIQITNAGLYTVVVSNAFGSTTNIPEQVVINPAGVTFGGIYPSVLIQGVVGYNYIIQSTTNLANTNAWVTVTNLTLTQPIQLYIDSNIDASLPANPDRFYQVLPGQ